MSDLSLSGVGSGIDWQSFLDQMESIEQKTLTPYTNEKTAYSNKLSAWQSFSSLLTTLDTATADLTTISGFDIFSSSTSSSSSVSAGSILTATVGTSSAKGSYQVVVTNKAQVEKLSSNSFTSKTSAMGISGTILVNGKAVEIAATDSLQNLQSKINATDSGANASGVTASILQDSANSYRLVLTSEKEGAAGISLLNATADVSGVASDPLASLGFNGSGTTIKNKVTGGATSDSFSSSSTAVDAQLGIDAAALSGTVTINGKTVTVNLSDSLTDIAQAMTDAGLSASVVSQTTNGTTTYKLQIEGMTSYTDQNSVLQSLGLIEGKRDDLVGVTGSTVNTTDGSTPISASTLITDIFGYANATAGDKITVSGTQHDGSSVSADLAIDGTTTVQDLLTKIQDTFGNVTASITSDGKLQVIDNATGSSALSVNVQSTVADANSSLSFGSFGTVGTVRKMVIQQGQDAAFTVDGVAMTSSSNTVTTAIQGVTLNLMSADPNTTVTVNVDRDAKGIEDKINSMLKAYNSVISYINTQMTYNADSKTTGGVLFGDNTLKSIKQQLQGAMMSKIGTGAIKYLSDIGISVDRDYTLSLDSEKFEDVLNTNFTDVVNLFSNSGTSSNGLFTYQYSGKDTLSGTYNVSVTSLGSGVITGTIDGVDISGTGTLLSLSNSTSNANGLGISYTGTASTSSATFTFTRGIASLLDNVLNTLTDSVDGTVTLTEKTMQDQIDRLTDKLSDMQTQIDAKLATLKTQFQAMDTAVANMNSTMSYLTSQLSKL